MQVNKLACLPDLLLLLQNCCIAEINQKRTDKKKLSN
jgi:hypothetical protein